MLDQPSRAWRRAANLRPAGRLGSAWLARSGFDWLDWAALGGLAGSICLALWRYPIVTLASSYFRGSNPTIFGPFSNRFRSVFGPFSAVFGPFSDHFAWFSHRFFPFFRVAAPRRSCGVVTMPLRPPLRPPPRPRRRDNYSKSPLGAGARK